MYYGIDDIIKCIIIQTITFIKKEINSILVISTGYLVILNMGNSIDYGIKEYNILTSKSLFVFIQTCTNYVYIFLLHIQNLQNKNKSSNLFSLFIKYIK